MRSSKSICLFMAVLALFAGAVVGWVNSTFTTPRQLPVRDFPSSVKIGKSAGKTLVILIDSLPERLMFSSHTPFLSSYRYKGAWGTTRVISIPLSIECTHAIFSGVVANPLQMTHFVAMPTPKSFDSFPARVHRSGRIFAACIPTYHALYGAAAGITTPIVPDEKKSFMYANYRQAVDITFKKSREMLSSRPWDVAATAFYELDYAGHYSHSTRSREYLSTLSLIDDYVRQLVALAEPQDTVLITSEHGMTARGTHVEMSPDVSETGFILTGPAVKKTGPETVLATDWAPTLSLLSGVSPFYTQMALPAFKILDLPKAEVDSLVREYLHWLAPSSHDCNLQELEHQRMLKLNGKVSLVLGLAVILAMLLSVVALLYMALLPVFERGGFRFGWNLLARMVFCGMAMTGLLMFAAMKFKCPPFSAKFMIGHFLLVPAFFALLAVSAVYLRKIYSSWKAVPREVVMLLSFTAMMTAILVAKDPYQPLNWVLASIPVLGWGLSRRKEWLIISGALALGLMIRRLTACGVEAFDALPPRWIIACALLAAAQLCLFWRMRRDARNKEIILAGTVCFAFGIAIIASPAHLGVKAALLIAWLAAVARLSAAYPAARYIWWGLWTAFFYLGTSGSIENTTHAVTLCMMPAAWLLVEGKSAAAKGMMAAFVCWLLYVLPSNDFSLSFYDLADKVIMGAVIPGHLDYSVALIAARNIIPAAILLWGLCWDMSKELIPSVASAAALPLVCGIFLLAVQMRLVPHSAFPWPETVRTILLLGHLVILVGAFAIVGLLRLARTAYRASAAA